MQFNAKSAPKGGPFSIVLDDTGKGGSVSNSVPAGKFTRGGVAMKVEVGPKAMSLTGHVSPAGSAKSVAAAAGTPMPKNGIHTEDTGRWRTAPKRRMPRPTGSRVLVTKRTVIVRQIALFSHGRTVRPV